MSILTPDQKKRLGIPPRPPELSVQLVDTKTGRPTAAYTNYLAQRDAWERKLIQILGE